MYIHIAQEFIGLSQNVYSCVQGSQVQDLFKVIYKSVANANLKQCLLPMDQIEESPEYKFYGNIKKFPIRSF